MAWERASYGVREGRLWGSYGRGLVEGELATNSLLPLRKYYDFDLIEEQDSLVLNRSKSEQIKKMGEQVVVSFK
ncbi:unnamed protein product [Dovyalis caffra]|uniref:Uncharacterized protein n=1 Tax=Dovyalis caffra TaxID=77055 RepID=A0AAV1SEV1_9ROSI|nr:unnamed protein product [Dovyalis caffra]